MFSEELSFVKPLLKTTLNRLLTDASACVLGQLCSYIDTWCRQIFTLKYRTYRVAVTLKETICSKCM